MVLDRRSHTSAQSSRRARSPRRCATQRRRCPRSRGSRSSTRTSSRTWSTSWQSCNRLLSAVRASATPETGVGPGTLEETQVRAMFDRIAGLYDRMNTVMTAGLHHQWRRRAADLAALSPGARALDVATGTGDLALELAARVGPQGEVVGVDFAERMLELARAKAAEAAAPVRFEAGNALALSYPDDSFDTATVGFGARNFSD